MLVLVVVQESAFVNIKRRISQMFLTVLTTISLTLIIHAGDLDLYTTPSRGPQVNYVNAAVADAPKLIQTVHANLKEQQGHAQIL